MIALPTTMESLLGPEGEALAEAMRAAQGWLDTQTPGALLEQVGRTIDHLPEPPLIDKRALQDSYGGAQVAPCDDFFVGRGLFYITEQRRLCLDATSGHYQMLWGYNPPVLLALAREAEAAGIVWDTHSNIPLAPVKRLARRLLEVANAPGTADPLDTALLGICTGSVACEAALKIQLLEYAARRGARPTADGALNLAPGQEPVFIVLDGHYHGTGLLSQHLRGMWPGLIRGVEVIAVEPNDCDALNAAFDRAGERAAGFWAELIMMNREAIALEGEFVRLARERCDRAGALMCIDEIQTGFWFPEVFAFRHWGIAPDLVICGKGMTAGYHPQSAVLYKSRHDRLQQYDAISTNGGAPLACLIGLACLESVLEHGARIVRVGRAFEAGLRELAAGFPGQIAAVHGIGHMSALKFHEVGDALEFHRRALDSGLWVRAHAYHAGHSTVLAKLGLAADETIAGWITGRMRSILRAMAPARNR